MDQQDILRNIIAMVEAEKRPRASLEAGETGPATEQARLTAPARALDRCGDLLRRRRAKAEFGGNPDEARPRPTGEVEGYQS
ncbi:DUF2630 family protein [Streptomyces diastaticus]|uniref:DUF2630 family protein n=1 Tax=Streptomyces TaxID=1883 RepID=UPI000C26053C|nr:MULTISPECIES: DUF2630 family protein [unclassified Streptomyces]NEE26388.1 DUF2630 family protein [Streptomyces sp. SID7982]PJM84141.1 hypothetical protein CH313_09390 [Streptomyces sp. TSRI0384-2]RPK88244.1 hypothetical protein EES47_15455 [Streptomyces sp. ADI98-12]